MTLAPYRHRRNQKLTGITGLITLAFLLLPSGWAEPGTMPSTASADGVVSGTLPVGEKAVEAELLRNFMASMTYTPSAVALPTDPILPVPYIPATDPLNAAANGSDADIDLPEPALPVKKATKSPKPKWLRFGKPVLNAFLSSPFGFRWGRMHEGIDLAVPHGTPITATEAGRVTYSGWAEGYGNFVVVDHGAGFSSRYGHASKLLVRSGQKVKKGQTIALVGSTGHSTGPHLHFELVSQGKHLNPLPFIGRTVTLADQAAPKTKAAAQPKWQPL